MAPPQVPDAADLEGEESAADETLPQRFLVRMAEQSVSDAAPATVLPRHTASWAWRADSGHESMIGTVAHAWLERIGKDGIGNWSVDRVDQCLPVFRKQLSRAGLVGAAVSDAAQVLRDTLVATLNSPKGQWLLWAARAHREWSLLDVSGRVSVIDLAISQEQDWLVVDYKTGVPHAAESQEAFALRMRERYREQIQRYCAHVSALDGRPARGALYFPRAEVWVDY
jgi:ATP-dependent exoDNAse (exonuclease V) beta subunit